MRKGTEKQLVSMIKRTVKTMDSIEDGVGFRDLLANDTHGRWCGPRNHLPSPVADWFYYLNSVYGPDIPVPDSWNTDLKGVIGRSLSAIQQTIIHREV